MDGYTLRLGAALAIGICTLIFSLAASANAPCVPEEDFTEHFARKYQEHPAHRGVTNTGQLVQVYVSSEGSWTIALISGSGRACFMAAGEGWQAAPVAEPTGTES